MTFGEKLTSLRKQSNMTQQDIAEKLMVSRQAVAKWERDVGLPDLDNVSKLSAIFNVKVDQLLDYKIESIKYEENGIVETIDKENSKLKNVNDFVLSKYKDAERIVFLHRERKLNVWEWIFDFFIGAGTLDVADILRSGLTYSYLVEKGDEQYLILISKTTLYTKKLDKPFDKKSLVVGGYRYTKDKNNLK